MKQKITKLFLIATVLVVSCKKKDNVNNTITYHDVIIGCKTGSSVVAAIDPIKSNEFAFKSVIDGGVVVGPSAVSTDHTRYYTIGSDKGMDEINTSTGEVIRSFSLSRFYFGILYDLQNAQIVAISSSNTNYEFTIASISLSTGQETTLGTIKLNMGIPTGTVFFRNGMMYLLSGNDLKSVDLNTLEVKLVKTLKGITNSIKYDSKKDKVYYMHSKDVKTFTLFSYDFTTNQDVEIKNYPNVQTMILNSTSYNESTGDYHFYNADKQRVTINVNTLDCQFELVDFPLFNTEVIEGNFYVPSEVLESK